MKYLGRAKRMGRHHARRKGGGGLNLVSLMDIFTILVFFLLVNQSEIEVLPSTRDVRLPESISETKPHENVVVLVTQTELLVQGQVVAQLVDVMARDAIIIPELKAALESQNERTLRQAAREDTASREVTIMGDKDIPYALLKRVMATCTDADFGRLSLAVLQKPHGAETAALPAAGG